MIPFVFEYFICEVVYLLGDGVSAKKALVKLSNRKGWSILKAIQDKRVYSLHDQFYNSPYDFVAMQVMAKWFYPEKFKDLDPEKTLRELHDRFLPIEYSGVFWAGLN